MKHLVLTLVASLIAACGSIDEGPFVTGPGEDPVEEMPGTLSVRNLATGLDTPWDIAMGPDGVIWVTERRGVVSRVDTASGLVTQVGTVDAVEQSESGLLGLALHPDFPSSPWVYLAYSYSASGFTQNRLVRRLWNGTDLGPEEILLDQIPGARNHDGARLTVGQEDHLFMTTGDAQRTDLPQNTSNLAGKVLRLTLDGLPAADNPFGNAVYSFGHRNPQGIVFNPTTGDLYLTEHGPSTNDEVNRIVAGGNYGWPNVHGFCDNDIGSETGFCSANSVVEPMVAWTPTIAPSGADFYGGTLIPEWANSILFTTLKGSTLYRLQLSEDGKTVLSQEQLFGRQFGRLRDVLVGPRGEVYLATSNRDGRGNPGSEDDRIIVIAR